jgi:glycine/D-amino acid oxidase-like deaminating enzyme
MVQSFLTSAGNEEWCMSEHAVVIAGGGPTGMMLAAELTLPGTDVLIVERRPSFKLKSSRILLMRSKFSARSRRRDSNSRPAAYKAAALTFEAFSGDFEFMSSVCLRA